MPRFNPAKNSFVAGELSPRLEGRDDLDQYFQGMRQAENGIILPHGGFMRRPGTRHVAEVKDSADIGRLIPFIFSTEAAYVVEAGDQYFRFYVNEGRLESGGSPVETSTPYTPSELADLQWTQSADVMWTVHPDHYPRQLKRLTTTSFSSTKVTFRDGRAPLRAENLTTNGLTVTGSGPYTLTWDSDPVDGGLSSSFDIKRAVRHSDGTDEAWYEITGITSSKVATADLKGGSASTAGKTTDWALGMFSDAEGPRTVTFHEGRLWYGGSKNEPDRLVGSVSDDFDFFELRDPSATDAENQDKSISRRVVQGAVNAIEWMASTSSVLVIGTSGGEFIARGENDDFMTPLGTVIKPASRRGSSHDMPLVLGDRVHFIQRNSRRLREFGESSTSLLGERQSRDISILAEHIMSDGGGALEMTYQQDPDSVIWMVLADGVLAGFTREQEQQVIGAHRHIVGGTYQGRDAEVESIAVIPSSDDDQDQLWVLIKRTIDGNEKRYVEFMEDSFRPKVTSRSSKAERVAALEEAFFVDSGLSLDTPLGGGITGITNANPAVVTTSSAHGLSNGDRVRLRGIVGKYDSDGADTLGDRLNHTTVLVANKASTTFELQDLAGSNIDTSSDTAYVTGGTVRQEVQSVSGLSHLEGETVQVFVDGALHPDKTVSSGSVTLDRQGSLVQVGLGYDTVAETQRFFGGGRLGGDQGQQMRIQRLVVRFFHTLGVELGVGPSPDKLEVPLFRKGDDTFDQSPPMVVVEDIEVSAPGGFTREPTVFMRQTDPLPMTILAVYPRMESEER